MKYEYMFETWGGFYNEPKEHNFNEGYFFFDTIEERDTTIKAIEDKAEELGLCVVIRRFEGHYVRYKTLAKCVFSKNGKEYNIKYDFGYAYPVDSAKYIFSEGNYSCDCTRSLLINEIYKDFPEMECGDEIKLTNIFVYKQID